MAGDYADRMQEYAQRLIGYAPKIDLSEDAKLGWIGVSVLAEGSEIETGASFSQQWAWIMMVKKIDDVWLHAGNASNRMD